jgi:hypothetical protein
VTPLRRLRALITGRSIAVRLAAFALFWSMLILLSAGAILSALYREATERAYDQRLLVYATDLASALVAPGDPDRKELGRLGDPRFELPLSGWYWQVGRPGAPLRDIRSSKSLFGGDLPSLVPPGGDQRIGEIRKGYRRGPEDRFLRILERDVDLGEDGRFVIRAAGPADDIDVDVRRFTVALTVTFMLLGLLLGLTTLLRSALACARSQACAARSAPSGAARRTASRAATRRISRRSPASSISCSRPTARSWSARARRSATSRMR